LIRTMHDSSSLRQLYKHKIATIRDYLSEELGTQDIRESEDFDRDGVVLRTGRGSESGFRIFIAHEFFSDFKEQGIISRLRSWQIAAKVRCLRPGFTLFITTEGFFEERTEGRMLRDVTSEFESILPLSERRKQLYDRVFAIPVDGVPLGDIRTEMQGDPELYIDYSDDFATVLGAAYLLDAAGYRQFQLSRGGGSQKDSGIDLEVTLSDGRRVFVDFKRAVSASERRENALREQINVELRRAMRDSDGVRRSIQGRFVQITLPRSPVDRGEVDAVVSEILNFAKSTNWQAVEKNEFIAFDARDFPLLDRLGARVYVAQGATYLAVAEGARSFDPQPPYRRIGRIVSEEAKYDFSVRPVWLAISLADFVSSIPSNILDPQRTVSFDVDATPFEQIIIGSAESANVYRRSQPAASVDKAAVTSDSKEGTSAIQELRQRLIHQANALEATMRDFEEKKQSGALGYVSMLPYEGVILQYEDTANHLLRLAPNDSTASSALQHAKTLRSRLN
jgi:hypothetical protein